MMDVETRIKLTIGDLVVQIAAQAAKIEELEVLVKELDQKLPTPKFKDEAQ